MDLRGQFEKWWTPKLKNLNQQDPSNLAREAFAAGANLFREELESVRANHLPLQARSVTWATAAFGIDDVMDRKLRALRFIEEAVELVQAGELSSDDVLKIVKMVYSKPPGEIRQEVGGVMVTLAVFCHALGVNMNLAGIREVERCWDKIGQIRTKNLFKPRPRS